jgi:chromosomal replication initiator protein
MVGGGVRGTETTGSDRHSEAEAWSRVKRRLRAELGEDVFTSWFARLEVDSITDGAAQLTVPTRFLKSWIEAHYLDRVLAIYRSEASHVQAVSIGVRSSPPREPPGGMKAGEAARSEGPSGEAPRLRVVADRDAGAPAPRDETAEMGGAPLDPRLTFESFIIGRSNALAHAAADRVAHHQGSAALYNPLYLHAGVGLGKTHLLHAIGHEARKS